MPSVRMLLLVMIAAAVVAIAAAVATRDPDDRFAVAAVVGGIGVAAAGIASLVLLRVGGGRRLRGRPPARGRALRRGIGIGAIVGILAALRVVDGLTPLTALFVVLAFAMAEYILSAHSTGSR